MDPIFRVTLSVAADREGGNELSFRVDLQVAATGQRRKVGESLEDRFACLHIKCSELTVRLSHCKSHRRARCIGCHFLRSLGFTQLSGFSVKGGITTPFFRVTIAMTSAHNQIGEKMKPLHKYQILHILSPASLHLLPSVFDLCSQIHNQVYHLCYEMTDTEGKGKRAQFRTRTTMDFDSHRRFSTTRRLMNI